MRAVQALRRVVDRSGLVDRAARAGALLPLVALNRLDAIAVLHGTDKSSKYHGYARYYADHLGALRWSRLALLEIGVGGHEVPGLGGRSLRMWRDYLPRADVVGFDLHEKALARLGPRVRLVQGDQSSADDLERALAVIGQPTVVVDDGSHIGRHVWASFEVLFPRLAPGGWYVIEDLHTAYLGSHEGRPEAGPDTPVGVVDAALASLQAAAPPVRRLVADAVVRFPGVAEVHSYPGIAFIRKAG